ncbi:MAG: hypothetical protein RSC27_03845 [Bacilli bacterium]
MCYFILLLSMMCPINTDGILPIVIASLNVFIVAFVFIKINIVNKSKRLFTRAIKKGYPELEKEFKSI